MTITEFKERLRPHYGNFYVSRLTGCIRTRAERRCPLEKVFGWAYFQRAYVTGMSDQDFDDVMGSADNTRSSDPELRRWMEEVLVA